MYSDNVLLAIKDEIETDPQSIGYSGKTATEIASLMNTERSQVVKEYEESSLSGEALVKYLCTNRLWKSIVDAQETSENAFYLVELLRYGGTDIQYTADIQSLITGLKTDTILTTENETGIIAHTREEILKSRAEIIAGGPVRVDDIIQAKLL